MSPIQVVGIGLDGTASLSETVQQLVANAILLVGSTRHLSYFPEYAGELWLLGDLGVAIAQIRDRLDSLLATDRSGQIVILTSGDPLFFGLGRLLLQEFPAECLTFHPQVSSLQLAFSRIKLPWQDARLISAHGRSLDELVQALHQGVDTIAVLTDERNTPGAISRLLQSLQLPSHYCLWVCENLGGNDEQVIGPVSPEDLVQQTFAPLNVVVLQRTLDQEAGPDLEQLPLLGISDHLFCSFPDRPGLMTKREVRVQILGELGLQNGQVVWDIGAGTGSVSMEIARCCVESQVFAIEKTAIGTSLIEKNCQRFQVSNVLPLHGTAPDALHVLPAPDRIFIGGSGGYLPEILSVCASRLLPGGRLVLALATLEHLTVTLNWLGALAESAPKATLGDCGHINPINWTYRLLQVQLSRSIPVANLTRFDPLNPVTLVVIDKTAVPVELD